MENSLQPINKQAATGCQSVGVKYDEKPFHALAGKGCLKWALKNCRVTESKQALIYKIAEGCGVPVLEVLPMVEEWIENGRAVWKEEGLVLERKKQRLSDEVKSDIAIWLFVRMKIVELCRALRGKIFEEPEFYIANIRKGTFDVVIQEEGRMVLLTDFAKRITEVDVPLCGPLAQVACATLMLRHEFAALVGIGKTARKSITGDEKYTTIAYSVTRPTKEQAAYISSLIKPMK